VGTRLVEIDALEDSALMKARVSAIFAGFIKDPEGTVSLSPAGMADAGSDPSSTTLEPGTVQRLPPGGEISFTPIADMSNITDLLRYMQRTVAAGGGLTYEAMTVDLSQVNYSSARLGASQFQRRIKSLQASLLGAQLLVPIWRRWVLLEILTGRIAASDFGRAPLNYLNAKFLWPGWPAIDPLKQSKADSLDLAARTKSRSEIVADHGRDISDVDQEIEDDPFVPDAAAAAALLAQPEEPQNAGT